MSAIALDDWKRTGSTFAWRGHRIFTRTQPRDGAPVLLLVHGFPTASWDWEAVWPALSERYHLLTLDMLGFGCSAKPRGHRYSILEQADLYEDFLRAQGVGAYHLLAHDYGDTVAQELLARQHDAGERPSLRSVCFLNGGLFPEAHRPLLVQRLLLSPLGPLVARLNGPKRFGRSMRAIFGARTPPDAETLDGFWRLLSEGDGIAALPGLIRYIPERREHRERWVGAMLRATIPLKLIDGGADPISGAHMADRYRELVPSADVTLLPDVGHYPQVESPREVVQAYLAFRDVLSTCDDG